MQAIDIRHGPDAYTWQVRYAGEVPDTTSWLLEYDNARPDGRGWAEVEQGRVRTIDLLPTGQGHVQSVLIPQGATPVFFRRRSVVFDPNSEQVQGEHTVHCIGWRISEEQGAYLFVFEDGSTLLSSDMQAV